MEDGVALGEQADEAEVVVGVGVGDEDRIYAEEAGGDLGGFPEAEELAERALAHVEEDGVVFSSVCGAELHAGDVAVFAGYIGSRSGEDQFAPSVVVVGGGGGGDVRGGGGRRVRGGAVRCGVSVGGR